MKDGFLCGLLLGITIASIMWGSMILVCVTPQHIWQKAAIQHNAARYNSTTGKFEWLENKQLCQ